MKVLPLKLSEEVFLGFDYAILRFMKSKRAYKTRQQQQGTIFTIKKIKEKNLPPQFHLHVRFNGRDVWYNNEEDIDLDLYLSEADYAQLTRLVEVRGEGGLPKEKEVI